MQKNIARKEIKSSLSKVFTSFQIGGFYNVKDRMFKYLKSLPVHKFNCARCSSCDIGETCYNFKLELMNTLEPTKIWAFGNKDLHEIEGCFNSFTFDWFAILGRAETEYQLKIKEGMYIDWEKPNLNKRFNHLVTILSI